MGQWFCIQMNVDPDQCTNFSSYLLLSLPSFREIFLLARLSYLSSPVFWFPFFPFWEISFFSVEAAGE
jgi:hypothetical protein